MTALFCKNGGEEDAQVSNGLDYLKTLTRLQEGWKCSKVEDDDGWYH